MNSSPLVSFLVYEYELKVMQRVRELTKYYS